MTNNIFVIGGCHHNILGVIRSLGEKGLYPYVIIESKEKNPYVTKSKYIRQYWRVESEQEVLEILQQEAGKHRDKPIVIACADNLSSLLDLNYDELSKHYKLPGAKHQGCITRLMDKEIMSLLAREVGFFVPESKATDTSLAEDIPVAMPWIIKPLVSKNGAKTDIERIYSQDEWDDYKCRHLLKVQVQQLIEKEFEYQLIGLSLDSGNEVIIPGISYVIRPSATTNTGFLRYESLSEAYKDRILLCKKFLQKAGYSGLFSMEFLRGKDGKDYFMEINFRNDGNAICVTTAGVNLPYIWCIYQKTGTYDTSLVKNVAKTVYVMPEFADISLIRHGQLSMWQWIGDIYRTDRFMEFDKKDMYPFGQLLVNRLCGFVKKKLKK